MEQGDSGTEILIAMSHTHVVPAQHENCIMHRLGTLTENAGMESVVMPHDATNDMGNCAPEVSKANFT